MSEHRHLLELTDNEALVVLGLVGLFAAQKDCDVPKAVLSMQAVNQCLPAFLALQAKVVVMTEPILVRQLEELLPPL